MDYTDWLGSAQLTTEQAEAFTAAADAYYALPFHTDRDPEDAAADQAEDDAALTAILQTVLEEDTLTATASRARQAQLELTAWVRAAAALGAPERDIADQARMARATVRKRLGR
ncbi:hypothetical protein FCK90_04365 [Kocuria coralli]|uniref:Uncharacterized protein n=1 Tax=Kocuria coralli TaxID=1461025 RepID=A0A5J5KYD3_9MICC|nr:hypothetical protein [Kocuria coralli]KAA9394777.1 hypothetical protein FCK90_04365 [Kocuria coralli]